MYSKITSLTVLIVGFSLTGCIDRANVTKSWYNNTKAEILKQSDLKADSTSFTFSNDSTLKEMHFYSSGHEFLLKAYKKGILRGEIYYSKNGNFELRREICDNGNFGFEGIVYKSYFYGLSTWRHCNGKIEEQGVRYHDIHIGTWQKYDTTGKLIEETYYNDTDKSMPAISNEK